MRQLINGIRRALIARRERKLETEYNLGFEWAAGLLLRGEMTPLDVQMELDDIDSEPLDDYELAYDDGARAALDLICSNKFAVIDNRMPETYEYVPV